MRVRHGRSEVDTMRYESSWPRWRRLGAGVVLALGLSGVIPGTAARAGDECTLIVGATAWLPGAQEARDVDLVLDGETIREVGRSGVRLAATGCRRVDASGQLVTAGFIDPWTGLGLVEVSGEDTTVDTDLKVLHQDAQNAVRAAVKGSLGYNPRSTAIPVARQGGVTSAMVVPTGGTIPGQAFWVDLAGARRDATIQRDPVAMIAALGARAESRASAMHILDVALREAVLWDKQQDAWRKNQRAPFSNMPLDLAALVPVVRGELPLVVSLHRAADIESLLELTRDLPVKLVLVGASEGWKVSDLLAQRKVPVILDPLVFGPGGFDQLLARPDNAALLAKAGVPVMLSTMSTHNAKKLRQVAGNAVREGLPWKDALRALTEVPATVFGLDRHGRLAPGALANLVVWTGDPFELATRATRVFVHGREVSLKSRQTELFERWRRLPERR